MVLVPKFTVNPMNQLKWLSDETVELPCETCGWPKTVNVVYVPFLDGKVRCRDEKCPFKNDKNV